jgi:hypothetical protein
MECGLNFLTQLRGSYSFLISDAHKQEMYIVTDRRCSRPCFYSLRPGGGFVFAPEVQHIARMIPNRPDVDVASALDFCTRGSFFLDKTMFNDIYKAPQAALFTLDKISFNISTYWDYRFADPDEKTDDEFCETFDHLLRQSVRRLARVVKKPFLSLSGGIDSRIVFGYFIQEFSGDFHVVSYANPQFSGDDCIIAKEISEAHSIPHTIKTIRTNDFPRGMNEFLKIFDGRIEFIDALPLINIWNQLAGQFDAIVNGHQCFSLDHRPIESPGQALNDPDIGFFYLNQVQRLVDWITPSGLPFLESEMKTRLDTVLQKNEETNPKLFKDRLYYIQRFANYLNGFTGAKMRVFEQARPLVDEDLIDAGLKIPLRLLEFKNILRQLLKNKLPKLSQYPLAEKGFLPSEKDYVKLLVDHQDARQFVTDEIENLVPELAGILDRSQVLKTLDALLEGRSLPVCGLKWYHRVPGVWRLLPPKSENKVSPIFLILRLAQTNRYIRNTRNDIG